MKSREMYPNFSPLSQIKWHSGNIIDTTREAHESSGQIIFDSQWDDIQQRTCELTSITILKPGANPDTFDNPEKKIAHTEYQLVRRACNGAEEHYLYRSTDTRIYVCDETMTSLPNQRAINQTVLQESLLESLWSYPLQQGDPQAIRDLEMTIAMGSDMFKQRMDDLTLDSNSRDIDTLVSALLQKYPIMLDEMTVRNGIRRYLNSQHDSHQ
jgi:hypothetical protein